MKLLFPAILGIALIGSGLFSPALAQPVCGAHRTLVESLQSSYSEEPVSMGITTGGGMVEVYASPTGTWTLVITQPNGVACLIAAGQDWEELQRLTTGTKT